MRKVLINETNLQEIANAIREKNGSSDTYTPVQMSTAIRDIPIGTSSDFEFGIDVKELEKEKGKRYTFKIVNYHDEELIQEDIPYEIHIYNPTESTFKITRDNQEKTLHKDESLVIEGSLAGKQKIEDYYTVQIVNYQKESSEEFLYIHIFSEKV